MQIAYCQYFLGLVGVLLARFPHAAARREFVQLHDDGAAKLEVNSSSDFERSKLDCTCGTDDEQWTVNCRCEIDPSCEWDFENNNCPGAEIGPRDEMVPEDASYDTSDATGNIESAVKVATSYPIVSQNTLATKDSGSHACWAVVRASASKFVGVLGDKGPKTEATRLYKANGLHTGWFAPRGSSGGSLKFPLGGYISRLYDGGSNGDSIVGMAKTIRSVVGAGNVVVVAMGANDCKGTFHYATIVGIGTKPGSGLSVERQSEWTDESVRAGVELIVADPWCPGYEGAAFYTMRGSKSLGKYDTRKAYDDRTEYSLDSHPCVRRAPFTGLASRPPTGDEAGDGRNKNVIMPYIDGLRYASGARCMYKMWKVDRR